MLSMSLTRADFEHALVTTAPNPSTVYGYHHGKINYIFNITCINKYRPYTKPKSRLGTS
jgi:hypothetical protein